MRRACVELILTVPTCSYFEFGHVEGLEVENWESWFKPNIEEAAQGGGEQDEEYNEDEDEATTSAATATLLVWVKRGWYVCSPGWWSSNREGGVSVARRLL
ncbi:unnamed protein product [Ilex paraguariensis]|uniref:Uncharacterized protein n=1 Tax=Ilex paraguariensis TaxID=185542 RepID=A0ABC8R2X5_9AQUA